MNKTITMSPNLMTSFKERSRRTKKNNSSLNGSPIRIKAPVVPKSNRTIKRSILKFIRNHQENNYKKLMNGGDTVSQLPENNDVSEGGDFEESVKYLMDITKEADLNQMRNEAARYRTLKNYDSTPDIIDNMNYTSNGIDQGDDTYIPPPVPTYGCLKNGKLPTYRQYSKTLKRFPVPQPPNYEYYSSSNVTPEKPRINIPSPKLQLSKPIISPVYSGGEIDDKGGRSGATRRMSEILQFKNKMSQSSVNKRSVFPKVKTTRRRTFNIGKSKSRQKISILISNKTIRNRVTTEAQLLKQTPINDVKRFLVKKGFIKVGSTTGNDVLREMYESIKMICGEIKNHNPETLLYNFHNDKDVMK